MIFSRHRTYNPLALSKILLSFFVLFFIFSFFTHTSAYAATYYVNTATGDDSHTTTQAQSPSTPWKTLTTAETKAANGDTVHIASGTYAEDDPTFHSWYTQKAINWVADGEVTVKAFSSTSYVLVTAGSGATTYTGITFDGDSITATGVYLNSTSNNKVFTDCTFKGATTQLIQVSGTSNSLQFIRPHLSGNPSNAGFSFNNATNLLIEDLTVSSFTSMRVFYSTNDTGTMTLDGGSIVAAVSSSAFDIRAGGNVTIKNIDATLTKNGSNAGRFFVSGTSGFNGGINISDNTITYNNAASTSDIIRISGGSYSVVVADNTITANDASQASSAIMSYDQPSTNITNNIISMDGTTLSPHPILVQASNTVGDVTVSGNTVTSTQTSQQIILVGTDTTSAGDNKLDGATITGNTIYGLLGNGATHGIEYGYNKNGTITNNYVYGAGYGIVLKGNGEIYTSGHIAYNILKDQSTEQVRVKGVQNLKIFNNTFYISSGRSVANGSLYITINAQSANVPSSGITAKNNIFYSQGGQKTVNVDSNSTSGLTLDYNLHYMETGISPIYASIGDTLYTSWTAWQDAGYDTHGINANPKLTSSTDFHLLSDSPAINAGINVGLTSDFVGTAVPQASAPDIGAYEFIGLVPGSSPDNNTTSSNSQPIIPPGCKAPEPDKTPQLYQVNTSNTKATLYFSPSGTNTSSYFISYGYSEGDERFGVEFPYGMSDTAITYTINDLEPNKTYYFKVRGGNDCMPGEWSNYLKATTQSTETNTWSIFTAWEQMKDLVLSWI